MLIALHVLFQLFQNRQPLGGGLPAAGQFLPGCLGGVEGLLPAAQLEGQPGADVGQLLFAAGEHGEVSVGVGQVFLQFGCAGALGLSGGLRLGQAAAGGLGGGGGGGFGHPGGGLPPGHLGQGGAQLGLPGAGGVAAALQSGQLLFQPGDLAGQLFGLPAGGVGRFLLAGQLRLGGVAVGLAAGHLLPQSVGAPAGVGAVVFQHGDAAVAAADLLGDTANIPIQALDLNGEPLRLHPDLLSLLPGGRVLSVPALILGLGGLVVPLQLLQRLPGGGDALDPEGDLQAFAAAGQLEVDAGLFGLLFQRADPAFQLGEDVPQPLEVGLGGGQAVLGVGLAVAEAGDAAGVLKDLPPLAALGGHDLGDAALPDDGVAVPADAGVQQQLIDVLQPADLAVDGVLAVARAVVPPAQRHLGGVEAEGVVAVVQRQPDRRVAHRPPPGGAAEDDVLHLAGAAQLPAAGLAQHPADGVGQVALARAVGPHHRGDPFVKGDLHLVGEALEPLDLQLFEDHGVSPSPG